MSQLEYYKNTSVIDIKGEIWKDIPNYEGIYKISNFGRIKSLSRLIRKSNKNGNIISKNIILKPRIDKDGYLVSSLNKNGKYSTIKVHRIVAQSFIPNPDNKPNVNHKNGIKTDNRVSELEWNTISENQKHRYNSLKQNGVNKGRLGIKNKLSKKVIQYTLDLKYIRKWDCISDIERELGFRASGIVQTCKKKQSHCGGFIWMYDENTKEKELELKKNITKTIVKIKDFEGELWIDVIGYEGHYMVSNLGRIKSLGREIRNHKLVGTQITSDRILKKSKDKYGYIRVSFIKNKIKRSFKVHRLVAIHFIDNKKNKPFVNHINGVKDDNRISNLEWTTESENSIHNFKVLKHKGNRLGFLGKKNKNSKNVYQYSLQGKLIKKWDSVSDASRELNLTNSCISRVCNGNYTKNNYAGFIWKYNLI